MSEWVSGFVSEWEMEELAEDNYSGLTQNLYALSTATDKEPPGHEGEQ